MSFLNFSMKFNYYVGLKVRLSFWLILIFLMNALCVQNAATSRCPVMCVCRDPHGSWVVDCTSKNLTSLPEDLDEHTEALDLSLNHLSSLPDRAFANFPRLIELSLVSNSISSLSPDVFIGLPYLQNLFLQGNRLQTVPTEAIRGLTNLRQLYLDHNNITSVPDDSFQAMKYLRTLRLDANLLTSVPVVALNKVPSLEGLSFEGNYIEEIPNYAFVNMTNLYNMMLSDNRIKHIGEKAFSGLQVLTNLELNKNYLKSIPSAISALPDLFLLTVAGNRINYIPDGCFTGNKKLSILKVQDNPVTSCGINAFSNMPNLKELILSEAHELRVFPNLAGTHRLEKIKLDRASVKVLPENVCENMFDLLEFDVHSNHISSIPNMTGCIQLTTLNLGNNEIASIDGSPFIDLSNLKDLTLAFNRITYISETAFLGLGKLQYLDLSNNRISLIHTEAFAALRNLEDLNVSENKFESLPTKGLQKLQGLKTFHNIKLQEPLPETAFPNIRTLKLAYAYQCCAFIKHYKEDKKSHINFSTKITWLDNNPNHTLIVPDDKKAFDSINRNDLSDWQKLLSNNDDVSDKNYLYPLYEHDINKTVYDLDPPLYEFYNHDNDSDELQQPHYYDVENIVQVKPRVQCEPLPDPFQPCDDLFGWWSLRCGVWIVFLLAVFGNGTVLFVSITSKSKMDVTRFLICNLAFSDLCMGVYLGFLAVVDASTLGEFENHAIYWQTGPGCLVAGFLGVLSSELSVFTLVVITIERFYAISHAMQLGKRVRLGQAGLVMVLGWIFCLTVASLPLFKVSDYRKFAICLPFDTEDEFSLAYVCFIMIFNAISFIVIVVCYGGMFLSIRASHSWNSKDTVVAKRMALLVFTDFFCWAPIIFFSLTAALNWHLARISLDEAKVLTIFVLPLNSCANPFLYAFFTRQFKRDCVKLCKRIEESTISRHFSSTGAGRSSAVSNRHQNTSGKQRSCDNSLNEPSTSGEASSSNNPSDDSDLTIRKLPLTREERRILRYVRSETGSCHPASRIASPVELSSPESQTKLSLVTRRHIKSQLKKEDSIFRNTSLDEGVESGHEIVLHTKEGNVYLSAKPKSLKSFHCRDGTLKFPNDKCAQRLCNYSIRPSQRKSAALAGLKSVQSQTTSVDDQNNDSSKAENDDVEGFDRNAVDKARRKFELERSKELGLKSSSFKRNAKQAKNKKDVPNVESSPQRTISTQTEMLIELRHPRQPELSADITKREKDKHINEWRKTSHLSFLWRTSGNFDVLSQKQKSNSLVELRRPLSYLQSTAVKRHSLTSRQEGYILLKNSSRDSAYEEDELYEFYDANLTCPDMTKHSQKVEKKKLIANANMDKEKETCRVGKECVEIEEACETTMLLTDPLPESLYIPKARQSCDMESGISSSS